MSRLLIPGLVFLSVAPALAQMPAATQPRMPIAAEDKITLVRPTVDKETSTVTLPAAFWNQQLRSVVEVALCGRPSDFLHETILSVTTTQDLLMAALREVGCHDADAWVSSVQDFPRIRGDRLLILLTFEHNGVVDTYAMDELLAFHGWNTPVGPYGWMFKGDPEHVRPEIAPTRDPITHELLSDAGKILRDDPQIAVKIQGIQHISQSFADSPLAYDEWTFPMMDIYRNTRVIPQAVYDSNGKVPVTLRIEKVNEEQFLEGIIRVWHDQAFTAYAAKQLPVARQIDLNKAELWKDVVALKQLPKESARDSDIFAHLSVKAAEVAEGYATLDAAWSSWAADHAAFDPQDEDLAILQQEAKLWKEHGQLMEERARQLATAEEALFEERTISVKPDADREALRKARGMEIAARSAALLADIKQPLDRWSFELKNLDPADPREFMVKGIQYRVALLESQQRAGRIGIAYGKALEAGGAEAAKLQNEWATEQLGVSIAQLQLDLLNTRFEISKREGIDNDPDMPQLKADEARLMGRLEAARAATQPATAPAK